MKRYRKSIIASIMIMSLATSMTTMVLAETTNTKTSATAKPETSEGDTINAVDVEVLSSETYVIDDKGTLWINNEASEFDKVCDDVKAVYEAYDYNTCLILKTDGTLVYAEEIRNTITDEATGELQLENTWNFFEIEKDVKMVSSNFYDSNLFILKNDGSLICRNFVDVYYKKLVYTGTEYEKYFDEYVLTTESTKTVIAKGVKNFTCYSYYNPVIFYIDNTDTLYALNAFEDEEISSVLPFKTPYKLLENVKDIKVWLDSKFALTNDGKVYALGQCYFNDYYYDHENDKEKYFYEPNGIVDEILGFETDLDRFGKPTLICDNAKAINMTYYALAVIKNDNSLWTMGDNRSGLLGLGEEVDNSKYANDVFPLAPYANDPYIAGTLMKVADDVVDVETVYAATLYTTEDGKLFATGRPGLVQINNNDDTNKVYLDSNGYYNPMSGVEDMSLGNGYSVTINEDGSLWGFGTDYELKWIYNSENETKAPEKLVDSVNWAKQDFKSILYTTGDNNDLYTFGATEDIRNKVELYKLELLGIEGLTLDDVANETDAYYEVLYSKEYESEEHKQEIYEKLVAYTDELVEESNSVLIASNVKSASDDFYLTLDNKLFERTEKGNKLVANNVDTFFVDSRNVYVVDTKGNLKYAPLFDVELFTLEGDAANEELYERFDVYDEYYINWDYSEDVVVATKVYAYTKADKLKFIDTGISNVKDVKSTIYDYQDDNFKLYILDKDNVLTNFSMKYVPINKSSKESKVEINFRDYEPTVVAENVATFDIGFYNCIYVTTEGVLYGLGQNLGLDFGTAAFSYYDSPIEIMNEVEKIELNTYGDTILTLKTDGTLLSSGYNDDGELGYPAIDYASQYTIIYTPIEVDLSK